MTDLPGWVSPIPDGPVTRRVPPAPLEGARVGAGRGAWGAAAGAFVGSLGISLETQAIGAAEGGAAIKHDDAARRMTDGGYDAAVLPEGDVSEGYLRAIMMQQDSIARSEFEAERAHLSGFTRGAASLLGAAADPLFLALSPLLGKAAMVARGGIAARAAYGAGEGAALMAAYDIGLREFGTARGDRDIDFYSASSDILWGTLLGSAAHTALGPRKPVTLETLAALERSDAAAAASGLAVSEVVSPAGAVGKYQIMPGTARGYGIDPVTLTDPAVNEAVAAKLLDDLTSRYRGDSEAVAIAYNAGPKWADRWIRAGRNDDILPKETQGYVTRLRELNDIPVERGAAYGEVPSFSASVNSRLARVAVEQMSRDAEVNVEGALRQSLADEFGKTAGALDALPEWARPLMRETAEAPAPANTIREKPSQAASALANDADVVPVPEPEVPPSPVNIIRAKVSPETAKVVQEAEAAVQEAKAAAEVEQDPTFPGFLDELNAASKTHDEFVTAVKSAITCALSRGL